MKTTTETKVENFIGDLFSKGYVGLNYCCTESGERDINHYELLESGQEVGKDCFDIGRIPLTSVEGKSIISDYLNDNGIVLDYPSKKSAIKYKPVKYYKNIIFIEGTKADVQSFKDQVTDTKGKFNPFNLFESLIDKEHASIGMLLTNPEKRLKYRKDIQRQNLEFSTEQERYSQKIDILRRNSIQGAGPLSKKDHYQLVVEYVSDFIPAMELYGASLRFPNIIFFLQTDQGIHIYDGTFLFQNGEIYYKTSHSYFKDSNGYSIDLNLGAKWYYVYHPVVDRQNRTTKYVDLGQLIPLQDQMIKIDNPISFCRNFPYELFISWNIQTDSYFFHKPNTVFHPEMLPSPETEPDDDFDL